MSGFTPLEMSGSAPHRVRLEGRHGLDDARTLTMSAKVLNRLEILSRVVDRRLTQAKVADGLPPAGGDVTTVPASEPAEDSRGDRRFSRHASIFPRLQRPLLALPPFCGS
jgi:hypothetical protein